MSETCSPFCGDGFHVLVGWMTDAGKGGFQLDGRRIDDGPDPTLALYRELMIGTTTAVRTDRSCIPADVPATIVAVDPVGESGNPVSSGDRLFLVTYREDKVCALTDEADR